MGNALAMADHVDSYDIQAERTANNSENCIAGITIATCGSPNRHEPQSKCGILIEPSVRPH